jgi:hypothetical protein
MVYRVTGFLDFFYRPVFLEVETGRFGNWICFRPQVWGKKTPAQLSPLERANLNNWVTPVRFAKLFNYSRLG